MRELLGVRFLCRCPRDPIWHELAIARWLRTRGFVFEALQVQQRPVFGQRNEIVATWLPG